MARTKSELLPVTYWEQSERNGLPVLTAVFKSSYQKTRIQAQNVLGTMPELVFGTQEEAVESDRIDRRDGLWCCYIVGEENIKALLKWLAKHQPDTYGRLRRVFPEWVEEAKRYLPSPAEQLSQPANWKNKLAKEDATLPHRPYYWTID